jgi:hypothetical protein
MDFALFQKLRKTPQVFHFLRPRLCVHNTATKGEYPFHDHVSLPGSHEQINQPFRLRGIKAAGDQRSARSLWKPHLIVTAASCGGILD